MLELHGDGWVTMIQDLDKERETEADFLEWLRASLYSKTPEGHPYRRIPRVATIPPFSDRSSPTFGLGNLDIVFSLAMSQSGVKFQSHDWI